MHKFRKDKDSLKAIIRRNVKHRPENCFDTCHKNKTCNYKNGQQKLTHPKFKTGPVLLLCMKARFICIRGTTKLSLYFHL
jgi:hypothetical protein